MKLIDSHCHILDPKFDESRERILSGMHDDDIELIVEIGATFDESKAAAAFAIVHDNVYATVGIHPHYAKFYCEEFEQYVRSLRGNKKIVAVGEFGLDYHYMNSPMDDQKQSFIRQIKLSHEMKLPMVIHTRDAFDDTLEILKTHASFLEYGVLMHCYSYGADEARAFMDLGDMVYFAFGGAITYKNLPQIREALKIIPRNRIMIETDAPYLSPVPLRGTVNEPKNVRYVAEKMAEILELNVADVAKITTQNTKRFYKII